MDADATDDDMDAKVAAAMVPLKTFRWHGDLPRPFPTGWWVRIYQVSTQEPKLPDMWAKLELVEDDAEYRCQSQRYRRWQMAENEFCWLWANDCVGRTCVSHLFNIDEEDPGETRFFRT